MALSEDLISQFVDVTKDNDKKSKETITYGTIKEKDGKTYVLLDGATEENLTPVYTTTNVQVDERVTVMIKNHTATVTGNMSSPAARTAEVEELDAIVADTIEAVDLKAEKAEINELIAETATIKNLQAENAEIKNLKADKAEIGTLIAEDATIKNLQAEKADIKVLEADYASIKHLEANYINAEDVKAQYADIKFANIDFATIDKATIAEFYSSSGLIKDVVVGDQTITGELVGVTIKGDLIEAGTLKADRLVIKGSDGKYYKLNTNFAAMPGVEPVNEDAIHGSVLIQKSIVAEKIDVKDLVAFDATIGGFKIADFAIHSFSKDSMSNEARGIYLDGKDSQISIGDGINYLKYFKDTDGTYKLAISAESIVFSSSAKNLEQTLDDLSNTKIGGRNLLPDSARELTGTPGSSAEFVRYADLAPIFDEHGLIEYTLSFDMKSANISNKDTILVYCQNNKPTNKYNLTVYSGNGTNIKVTTEYVRYSITFTPTINNSSSTKSDLCFYGTYNTGNIPFVKNVKLEKGNKATDWTPAIEDTKEAIDIAGKTASNYIKADNTGLMVAKDVNSATVGNNVFIDSDSVDVRNGETVSASFAAKKIELGKDSKEAIIDLCSGMATISATDENSNFYDGIALDSQHVRISADNPESDGWSGVKLISHTPNSSSSYATAEMFSRIENQYAKVVTKQVGASDASSLLVGLVADKRENVGWSTHTLTVTPYKAMLDDSDGGHSGLIRPWNVSILTSLANLSTGNNATLKEKISEQPTGIVLTFFDGSEQSWHTFFIPKLFVTEENGFTYCASWVRSDGTRIRKVFRITDTSLTGASSTTDGILQKIYGV